MRWSIPLLLLAAFPAPAEDTVFRPEWTASCRFGGIDAAIRFKSVSGHADRDDQSVTLSWGKDEPVALPIQPALFVPARFVSDTVNHCHGIGAFDWPNGRVLLLIPRNDRPSDDRLLAVVIDGKTGAFVQDGGALGAVSSDVMLLKRSAGYGILLERSWHVDATSGGEFAASDWMLLRDADGRLVHEWETRRK